MAMTMPTGSADEADVMIEINTTPLIDVMLVLLIMLILTIPVQTNAVKLDMPSGTPPSQRQTPPVVQIDIAADGAIAWNGETLGSREQLETRLRDVAANPAPTELHLRPDKAAPYRAVAMVMASAQRLGATRIGLVGNEQFMQ
ncbi:biopolymer transporter ExbD [Burkholderia cepacia JBK9]|uniref:Biopolymer transporter ExbD n=1 Tax=Burkholderia arboris TaxID=488730 RepID=A0A9Q9UPR4_9BURK|nr:biopolymer transporter ExbD [Burkholderia arboris]ALX12432.1 biopolymer transporter ExbD [Burkholderia cepacia JBK9]MCA8493275.1 biopolymer transporter ExbD [Burkholderia arboris]UTV55993.1 biopolymer transporter ExbD [Burkholderia arboris]VWB37609.1 biopolymer transporter ExbD [Burkholderia arboris]